MIKPAEISSPLHVLHTTPSSDLEAAIHEARWPIAVLGFGAALLFYLNMFRFPMVPIWRNGDEVIFLDHAARMLHGEILYRDLFQFNLPGTEYLYYFLFRCFGVRLWIEPLLLLLTETAVTLLVYSLSRLAFRGAAALLPAVAFLVFCQRYSIDGSHHWYSTLLVLLAINLIARARRPASLATAGALLGLATLFTSSRGVFVAAGVSLFFVWKFRGWHNASKTIAILLVPFAAVIATALIYLALLVGPRVLFESVIVFPLRNYGSGHGNSPSIFFQEWKDALPIGLHSWRPVFLWFTVNAAVPLVLFIFIAGCFRRKTAEIRNSRSYQTLVLYTFAASFALLPVVSSPLRIRLNCAACFVYILGAAMLSERGRRRLISGALAIVEPARSRGDGCGGHSSGPAARQPARRGRFSDS